MGMGHGSFINSPVFAVPEAGVWFQTARSSLYMSFLYIFDLSLREAFSLASMHQFRSAGESWHSFLQSSGLE